jgi:putative transposase
MALDQSALLGLVESLRTGDESTMMRRMLTIMLQQLIEAEATATIGAERYERSEARTTQRNGHRPRTVSTTSGDLEVAVPKLRQGSFFPSLLTPRRRVDVALHAVVMEAFVHGVSTRKVDDLVVALGADTGISKSEVSRICAGIDEEVGAWLARPLDHIAFPYVFLDASRPVSVAPARGARVPRSSPRPPWWPSACPPTGAGRCWAPPRATARTRCSGPSSCAACASAG